MNQTDLNNQRLINQWSFPWPIMDVLIGGRSSIDLEKLILKNENDAKNFLRSYGYDPDAPNDLQKLHEIFIESINFIQTQLIPREWEKGKKPPKEFLECENPAWLLLWASGIYNHTNDLSRSESLQAWSCAVLRVMHTIAHLDDLQRLNNIHDAKTQIMNRFRKILFRDKNGQLLFGNADEFIQLEKMEWKTGKSRNSMLLKLLHKPANVSETIYDFVGVRIVTKTLSETMIVVKYLRQFYLIDFPNTHPVRSRNNLIDVPQFRRQIETMQKMLQDHKINHQSFQEMLLYLKTPINLGKSCNPHSAREYRSIQLTCRQRVRYPSPALSWMKKLETYLSENHGTARSQEIIKDFLALISSWCPQTEQAKEVSIFFPFEVQILDKEAAYMGENGAASHNRYKKAQVRSARRRIMGKVLTLP
ncbi:MAG: TIGR04552 family protein [Deltaproteobacteria bacterium]|nr:TIGR04552 family protein [Deltaproteobacteria bacterium]